MQYVAKIARMDAGHAAQELGHKLLPAGMLVLSMAVTYLVLAAV